jgi:flagellar biosynthesis chaperone FliJ
MNEQRRYPLETLLEQRRRRRDDAQKALAQAHERVAACTREVQAAVQQVAQRRQAWTSARNKRTTFGVGGQVQRLAMLRACEDRLASEIQQAERQRVHAQKCLTDAEQHCDQARCVLQEAYQQLEVMRKHKARWHNAKTRAEEKAAEQIAEEIAGSQYWRHE